MKQNKTTTYLLAGSLMLIVLAIGLVSILGNTGSATETQDVRARASATNSLKVTGVVGEVDETKGTFTLSGVQFDDESRSGEAQDLGTWTVTPPGTFNLASLTTGTFVSVGVDPTTFKAETHTMSALTVTIR